MSSCNELIIYNTIYPTTLRSYSSRASSCSPLVSISIMYPCWGWLSFCWVVHLVYLNSWSRNIHYQKTEYPWGPAISLRCEIKPPRIYNYLEGCIKPPRKCIFLSAEPNRQVKSIFPWVLVETAKVILCFLECYYKPPKVIHISLGVTRNRQGSSSFFGCKPSSKLL